MQGIRKTFPGVVALDEVDLTLQAGEVLALLGENGAGKSTLIKMLGGAHRPDSGSIEIEGSDAKINSPQKARELGISVIYQEFNLVPDLTVRENLFLGREKSSFGFLKSSDEQAEAEALLARIGAKIDPGELCRNLTVAEQQMVEIARALSVNARIVVMDEPSAVLTVPEVEKLFEIIRELKSQGIGIIYISHRLDEIFTIADRTVVLRDGRQVGEEKLSDLSREQLIEMMVGRSMEAEFPTRESDPGEEKLRVENLNRGRRVRDVSFSVRAGEILGFAGLVGAGRTETMRLIAGIDRKESGEVFLNQNAVEISDPRHAIRARICLLTEDRKSEGLILQHGLVENFGLPNLSGFASGLFLNQKKERESFADYTEQLRIKISDPDQEAGSLSGGNQQKVVLAKWLVQNADVIIFDEPTRGIDVGAKYEIYQLIHRLADEGKAIIMVSSELPEVIGMSDRIVVMHEGRKKGEIENVADATQEQIFAMAMAD